jgi:hypothetical protein
MHTFKTFLLCSFMTLAFAASAQVREEVMTMPQVGAKNAYVINLPKCTPKLAEKIWREYLKKNYKGDASKMKKADELFTDNILIAGISSGNNPVDIYARMDASGDDTRAIIWVDLGGVYVNSAEHAAQSEQVQQMLYKFGIQVAREQVQAELEVQEKKLKGLEGDQKKLERDNADRKKDIEDYKAKIQKAEEDIKNNEKDQEAKKQEIESEKKIIEATRQRLSKLN